MPPLPLLTLVLTLLITTAQCSTLRQWLSQLPSLSSTFDSTPTTCNCTTEGTFCGYEADDSLLTGNCSPDKIYSCANREGVAKEIGECAEGTCESGDLSVTVAGAHCTTPDPDPCLCTKTYGLFCGNNTEYLGGNCQGSMRYLCEYKDAYAEENYDCGNDTCVIDYRKGDHCDGDPDYGRVKTSAPLSKGGVEATDKCTCNVVGKFCGKEVQDNYLSGDCKPDTLYTCTEADSKPVAHTDCGTDLCSAQKPIFEDFCLPVPFASDICQCMAGGMFCGSSPVGISGGCSTNELYICDAGSEAAVFQDCGDMGCKVSENPDDADHCVIPRRARQKVLSAVVVDEDL